MCSKVHVLVTTLALAVISHVIVAAAHAQEIGPLIKRLSDLTERKGYKNAPYRPWVCEGFGWSDCRGQLAFQAPFGDNGTIHMFYSGRFPGNQPRRIVIVIRDEHSGHLFWTDLDGTLRACLRGQRVADQWHAVKISCQESEAKNQFYNAITYWRTKGQAELENEPDRKD